jgi:N,N'-diacetyllegionaminate synthase
VKVVAEAGQCMMGDVRLAIKMAEWAKQAGAYGFKTQLLKPETIAAADAPLYWKDQFGTKNQREAFELAGLIDYGAWREVKDACDDIGIEFFATPFDLEAVESLYSIGVTHFKVASGDLTFKALIETCHATGGQVILSTGAAYQTEITRALCWAPHATLLACTLSYPTPLAAAHLARIKSLQNAFPGTPVGYSDHTSHNGTALGAAVLGASMLEVHYTHDKTAGDVPDHAMALDPEGLADYVVHAQVGALLHGNPDLVPCSFEDSARQGARRSAHATRDLVAGERLAETDVVFLRPNGPIAPWHDVIGRTVIEDTKAGAQIRALR